MERQSTEPPSVDEPTRVRLDELLADMQEVLTGLPARKLHPMKDEGLAELPTSGIFDMRDMARAYEADHAGGDYEELVVTGPVELALAPPRATTWANWTSMLYLGAGALAVLLVALTAVATTVLFRAG